MIDGSSLLRLGIVAAAVAVLVGAGTVAANAQEPIAEECLNPAICPIHYVRLAKQETEPFLFLGKVVDEKRPRYEDYKSPIQKSGNENNGLKCDRDSPIFAKNAENRALTALSSSPLQAMGIITY